METRDGLAFPPQKRSRRPPTWPGATLTSQIITVISRVFHPSSRLIQKTTARDAHGHRLSCSVTAILDKTKVRKGFSWIWDLIWFFSTLDDSNILEFCVESPYIHQIFTNISHSNKNVIILRRNLTLSIRKNWNLSGLKQKASVLYPWPFVDLEWDIFADSSHTHMSFPLLCF